jgi:GTPase SAR1 family protein
MQRNYDYVFKVCFVGQSGVGKTALMRRYADDSFEDNMLPTIGVDFRFK